MSRVPSQLRGIKIKELREMQKSGMTREKQLYSDVLGTRLLASANRPMLKRYARHFDVADACLGRKPSKDEVSDSDGISCVLGGADCS
jgi:hypothetical protein